MKVDWLIVGAGFTGCILAERLATQLDQKVLIVDRRDHIGGNAYDEYDKNGILIHKYGPHIFHTNSEKVWNYLSQFTDWRQYFHKVLAVVDGEHIPVPFNLNSLYQLFSPIQAKRIESLLIDQYGYGAKVPILKLREESDDRLNQLAEYIYKNIFLGYTIKQWGISPIELDESVTSRVPVYISKDNRYFQDRYQAMPKYGYTEMFRRLIKNQNIKVLLKADYLEVLESIKFKRMIYTGPVDAFFNYMHGRLPYRSLKFESQYYDYAKHQEAGQINYPNNYDHTRICEYKYITGQNSDRTTVIVEYPQEYILGVNEAYYPILNNHSAEIHRLYKNEISKLGNTVVFAGRLADYKYYNMDQVVARALSIFDSKIVKL